MAKTKRRTEPIETVVDAFEALSDRDRKRLVAAFVAQMGTNERRRFLEQLVDALPGFTLLRNELPIAMAAAIGKANEVMIRDAGKLRKFRAGPEELAQRAESRNQLVHAHVTAAIQSKQIPDFRKIRDAILADEPGTKLLRGRQEKDMTPHQIQRKYKEWLKRQGANNPRPNCS